MSDIEIQLEELKAERTRLRQCLDDAMGVMESMAEGICMLNHPNWTTYGPAEQRMFITDTVNDWIERYFNERHR